MQLVTSLSFSGQCRAAFKFYQSVLGGEIQAFPFAEAPDDMPVDKAKYGDWLMHAWLQIGDHALMGADMPPEFAPNIDKPKNGFDVTVHFDDAEDSRRVFDALSEGGKVVMPFAATFWSKGYGSFIDKFGVPWMINTQGEPA
ncbi:MAG: VOC family protein [Caulobacteraceae bacterium]|nr:MAG: VOC family protein [Caulobacteraceae bacterium]